MTPEDDRITRERLAALIAAGYKPRNLKPRNLKDYKRWTPKNTPTAIRMRQKFRYGIRIRICKLCQQKIPKFIHYTAHYCSRKCRIVARSLYMARYRKEHPPLRKPYRINTRHCKYCKNKVPPTLFCRIEYCSNKCRVMWRRRRLREKYHAKQRALPRKIRHCKYCSFEFPPDSNQWSHRRTCDVCRIKRVKAYNLSFKNSERGKQYFREHAKKWREKNPEKYREMRRRVQQKIKAERRAGLRPPDSRERLFLNRKAAWKKELMKWEPKLRGARMKLTEVRKTLKIGHPLKYPEVWPSLIEALKREGILPT